MIIKANSEGNVSADLSNHRSKVSGPWAAAFLPSNRMKLLCRTVNIFDMLWDVWCWCALGCVLNKSEWVKLEICEETLGCHQYYIYSCTGDLTLSTRTYYVSACFGTLMCYWRGKYWPWYRYINYNCSSLSSPVSYNEEKAGTEYLGDLACKRGDTK